MSLTVIEVPYDSGHRARRMGLGPLRLIEHGLVESLEYAGHEVRRVEVGLDDEFPTEIGTALGTQRLVAELVRAAATAGRFPLVLSGNCATAVGSVAGVGGAARAGRVGVVWLDSHGDFNTPETSSSGFFDGMVLSMLTGDCWRAAAEGIPGFAPVEERLVVLVGARELDPAEAERLDESAIERVDVASIREHGAATALAGAIDRLAAEVDAVYLHLDLDVLDPLAGRVNPFQAADGLRVDEIEATIDAVAQRLPLAAAALTAFDPHVDVDGAATEAAVRLAAVLAARGDSGSP